MVEYRPYMWITRKHYACLIAMRFLTLLCNLATTIHRGPWSWPVRSHALVNFPSTNQNRISKTLTPTEHHNFPRDTESFVYNMGAPTGVTLDTYHQQNIYSRGYVDVMPKWQRNEGGRSLSKSMANKLMPSFYCWQCLVLWVWVCDSQIDNSKNPSAK